MTLLPMVAAAGVWPALPLTGYLVFTRLQRSSELEMFPALTAVALLSVTGLALWSVLLLATAMAGVFTPAVHGLLGWAVTGIGLVMVRRSPSFRRGVQRGAPGDPATQKNLAAGSSGPAPDARQAGVATRKGASAVRPERGRAGAPAAKRKAAAKESPGPVSTEVRTGQRPESVPRESAESPASGTIWNAALAIGLILAAGLYLGFPTESIYGARDEGVYASHAIYLAHHGRLEVPYAWPADLRDTFAPYWIGFPGFYKAQDSMTAQFGHLFPVWLAQAFATLGAPGLFRLNAVFAWLALGIFFGLCRLLVGRAAAVVATLFLAFNPSQLWMARITLSEVFAQLFIWSGLLVFLQAVKARNLGLARWAGAFFGLSAFVRFDGFLVLPLLFLAHAVFTLLSAGGSQPQDSAAASSTPSAVWGAVYQTALPVCALALMYYASFSLPYFREVSQFYLRPLVEATVAGGVVLLLALLVARTSAAQRLVPLLTSHVVFGCIAALVVALAAYAYWLRPGAAVKSNLSYVWPGYYFDRTRDYGRDSLVNLARYLSPPVVWVAVAGWVFSLWGLLRRADDRWRALLLVLSAGGTFLYIWSPGTFPDHFWAIRRFVPIVVPAFVLFAAVGMQAVLVRLGRPWSPLVAAVTLVFLSVWTIQAGSLIFTFTEDAGYYRQLQELAEKLPADEWIVVVGHAEWVTPLYVAFDRKLVPLGVSTKSKAAMRNWLSQQGRLGHGAYLLFEERDETRNMALDRNHHNTPLDVSDVSVKLPSVVLTRNFTEATTDPPPKRIGNWDREIVVYQAAAPGSAPAGSPAPSE